MPFKRRNGADVRASLNDDTDHMDYTPYMCSPDAHEPIAGMMVVHAEDLEAVASERAQRGLIPVQCYTCDARFIDGEWRH